MIYFSILNDDNIVTSVLVSPEKFNEQEEKFSSETGQKYKQTYKHSPTHNFAGVGFTYREDLDNFAPPSPFPSWSLNTNTMCWEPPNPRPVDENHCIWDEESTSWLSRSES